MEKEPHQEMGTENQKLNRRMRGFHLERLLCLMEWMEKGCHIWKPIHASERLKIHGYNLSLFLYLLSIEDENLPLLFFCNHKDIIFVLYSCDVWLLYKLLWQQSIVSSLFIYIKWIGWHNTFKITESVQLCGVSDFKWV